MDAQSLLSPQLEGILLEMIDRGVWATRERLKYGRAIHTLDEESRFLHPQPYSTNLDMRFDTLVGEHSDLLNRISDYLAAEVITDRANLKAISPTAFGAKKITIGTAIYLVQHLGLDIVESDQVAGSERLLLLAGAHSEELVSFWRTHDHQIAAVITLLGTTREHITRDLGLPADKYFALASRDTLSQIDPERRKIMIPGIAKETVRRTPTHMAQPPALPATSIVSPTDDADSGVAPALRKLTGWVRKITYPGEFLLSVNKFSDSWLYIVDFNEEEVWELASDVLAHILPRYLDQRPGQHILFCSEMGPLSEDEFATLDVANSAITKLGDDTLTLERYLEPEHGEIVLNPEDFAGKRAIGFFVLSIHVDFLLDTIAKIREAGGEVVALVTIIERDDVGRSAFAAQGVDLIPFILWDAENKELKTVLERTEATYTSYHALFA